MVARWAGVLWYGAHIVLAGRIRHAESAVTIADLRRGLDLHYHTLGGTLDRRVVGDAGLRGNRLAATFSSGVHDLMAWLDPEQVHLPRSINRYPTRALNRELFFWLAAYLAEDRPLAGVATLPAGVRHLLRGVATSARVERAFPALGARHARLCAAERAQRASVLPGWDVPGSHPVRALETAIRHALGSPLPPPDPWLADAIAAARAGSAIPPRAWPHRGAPVPFLPVALWGQPPSPTAGMRLFSFKRRLRRRTHGDNARIVRPWFDTSARGALAPGAPVRGRFTYPEWSAQLHGYRADWCLVTEQVPVGRGRARFDEPAHVLAQQVRRQFEGLHHLHGWSRRRESGDELDLDACVQAICDQRACGRPHTQVWQQRVRRRRDLSVAVLMDTSRSTEAWVGEHRVIGIARRSMLVLGEALATAQDDFALFAFDSDTRLRVTCHRLKDFDESYGDDTRRRLLVLEPQHYTRLGAAIRHVGARLDQRAGAQRLLLVLTDARPHDPADGYIGHAALEDTRRALLEQRARGMQCVGLTIDQRGAVYLPRLFGSGHYAVLADPRALPQVLPRLLARITGRTS